MRARNATRCPRLGWRRHPLLLVTVAVVVALALGSCAGAAVEQQDTTAADVATVEESAPSDGLASKTDTVPEFVATADWQELLPGQGVPRGLHVRLNLETGKREAKLVDPEEEGTEEATRSVVVDPTAKKETTVTVSTDISGDIVAEEDVDDSLTVTEESIREDSDVSSSSEGGEDAEEGAEPNWNHEKIVEVLQALPEPPKVEGMDIHDAHAKLPPAEFRQQIITMWKKRQAELKEAIASLQDDAKYLAKLLEQFQDAEQKDDTAGQLSVLEVLEWEVQDLDKTHVFNFIGGFGIMAEYLNSSNLPVRAHASWLVGTAAKNYKDGQEWAIDAGSVPKLIASLGLEVPSAGEGLEASEQAAKDVLEAKKKALYALSSLVRVNERGQRLFLLHNGPEFLAGLLSSNAHPAKLQMKALLFVYDLLLETAQDEAAGTTPPSSLQELQDIFRSPDWCDRVSAFFVEMAPQLVDREVIELVDAMRHQLPSCKDVLQASGVKTVVEALAEAYYREESEEDKEDLKMFFQDFLERL